MPLALVRLSPGSQPSACNLKTPKLSKRGKKSKKMKSTEKKEVEYQHFEASGSGRRLLRALPLPLPEAASGIPLEPWILLPLSREGCWESTGGVEWEVENS